MVPARRMKQERECPGSKPCWRFGPLQGGWEQKAHATEKVKREKLTVQILRSVGDGNELCRRWERVVEECLLKIR